MKKIFGVMAVSVMTVSMLSAFAPATDSIHFALSKSSPEADASVEAPSEIRLWFTQEPQDGTTSIRVVEADEAGVHVGDVEQHGEDPTSFAVPLHGTLPPGTYTVAWRGMGQDGHVVRETFTFTSTLR